MAAAWEPRGAPGFRELGGFGSSHQPAAPKSQVLRAGFFNHYWRRAAASGAGDVPEKPSTGGGSAASVLGDEDLQGVPLTTVPSLFQQSFEPLLISTISIFSLQISQGRREPATGRAWLVLGTQLTPMGTRPQPCRPLSSSYRAFQSAGEREVSLQTAP